MNRLTALARNPRPRRGLDRYPERYRDPVSRDRHERGRHQPDGASIPAFAVILAEAERQGLPYEHLHGTIQNVVMPGGEGEELLGNYCIDMVEFCARHMPRWNHTSISARNMHDQELSSVQEASASTRPSSPCARPCRASLRLILSLSTSRSFQRRERVLEEVATYTRRAACGPDG